MKFKKTFTGRVAFTLMLVFKLALIMSVVVLLLTLVFYGVVFALASLGGILLTFSNNANGMLNGATNGLGFVGSTWQSVINTANPFLLCLDSPLMSYNTLARLLLAIFGVVVETTSIETPPSWWMARGIDEPFTIRDMVIEDERQKNEIQQMRHDVIMNVLRSKNITRLEDADDYTRMYAIHEADEAVREIEQRDIFGDIAKIVCTIIEDISNIFQSIYNIFSPFFLGFLELLVQAIEAGNAGDDGEFVILFIQFILTRLLDFLGLGVCFNNIPGSIFLCMFPGCPYSSDDLGIVFVGCALSPVCTVSNPANAGDILYRCLHIQDIVDFGLSVYDGIKSLEGVVNTVRDFFVDLWEKVKSLKSTLDGVIELLRRIAGKFGISFRGVVMLDNPHLIVDRIAMVLGFDDDAVPIHPAAATLWDIYRVVNQTNSQDYKSQVAFMRKMFVGTQSRSDDPKNIRNAVFSIVTEYWNDRKIAYMVAKENLDALMLEEGVLPDDPRLIEALNDLNRVVMPRYFYNISVADAIDKDLVIPPRHEMPPEMAATAFIVQQIGTYYTNQTKIPQFRYRSFESDTTPIWKKPGTTFTEGLSLFMRANPGETPLHKTIRAFQNILENPEHWEKLQTLAVFVRGMSDIFRESFREKSSSVPQLRAKMSRLDVRRAIAALHGLSYHMEQSTGTYISEERAINMRLWAARWVDQKTFNTMSERLVEKTNDPERIRSARDLTEHQFHERLRQVRDDYMPLHDSLRLFESKRLAFIATLSSTGVTGLLSIAGVPMTLSASLIPALITTAVPVMSIAVPLLPNVLIYVATKGVNMITNAFNGGGNAAPDIISNVLMGLGPSMVSLYSIIPTQSLIDSMFAQLGSIITDTIDDVTRETVYRIACNVPPLPFIGCPQRPKSGVSASRYLKELVYSRMDEYCQTSDDCYPLRCRRLVDTSQSIPGSCQMECTSFNPCSPPGICVGPPLASLGNCLEGSSFNITFNVVCTNSQFGYPDMDYTKGKVFQSNGFSVAFFTNWEGIMFLLKCILCLLVFLRLITRVIAHGYQLPVLGIFSQFLLQIPLVPGFVSYLTPITLFGLVIPPKVQYFAVNSMIPFFVRVDSMLWFVDWFGISSPFLSVLSLVRFDNWTTSPPLGSPLAGDWMCPFYNLAYIFLGAVLVPYVTVILWIFFTFGGVTLLWSLMYLVYIPLRFMYENARIGVIAERMRQQRFLSNRPHKNDPTTNVYSSVGSYGIASTPADTVITFREGTVPTLLNTLTNQRLMNDVLHGREVNPYNYIQDPEAGTALSTSTNYHRLAGNSLFTDPDLF